MKHIYQIIAGVFLALPLIAIGEDVQLIGEYAKFSEEIIGGDPHATGYEIDLYKQGNFLFGELIVGTGSIDIKSGLLENITLDETTKSLKFTAKLSTALTNDPETGNWRPTRDLYIFSGKIDKHFIIGTLEHRDGYKEDVPGNIERIKFPRFKNKNGREYVPKSLDKWLKYKARQDW
jgi:hypothetical protein